MSAFARRLLTALPSDAPFDWAGVLVGHWSVLQADGADKHGGRLYRCVSRCGVAHRLTASSLAAGGPKTCQGCRPGAGAPSATRIVPEADLARHHELWESTRVNVRSNLKGKEATHDWDEYGLPVLTRVLAGTAGGLGFGWSAFVRDCHERSRPKGEAVIRVKSSHPGQRRIELHLRPTGGRYSFEVDLTTGRADDFARVLNDVRAACQTVAAADPPAADGPAELLPAAAAPPPGLAQSLVGVDLDRLLLIRSGIDRLHATGTALRTVAGQKAEAAERLAAAEKAERECVQTAKEAADHLAAACGELAALTRRRDELKAELADVEAQKERAVPLVDSARERKERADAMVPGAEEAAELARMEFEEVVQAEEKHVRAMAEGAEMAPLLAALAKLAAK